MVANKGGASRNDVSDMGSGGATLKKGPWTAAEDAILMEYVRKHGEGNWNAFQKNSGLSRCGKSCRLRWANHLRPNLKKGSFSPDEERLILELHSKLGNKWARMAAQLPGRTDNEIKNYWNTRVKRRQRSGLPLYPHNKQKQARAFHLHQHNQPHPSPSPPTIPLSRSQQKKPSFGSSLSMFEPMKFSTTTPLFGHQDSTHFRNTNIGFLHPFNPPTSAQPSSLSLFNQNFSTQSLPTSTLHFNSHNYNLNPPTDNIFPHGFAFSTKMELPSSQLPQPSVPTVALGTTNDNRLSPSLAQTNSGLLDAMLQDVEVIGGGEGGVRREGLLPSHEEKSGLDEFIGETPPNSSFFNESPTALQLGSPNHLDDSGSVGVRTKKESTDETHSMDDDGLSSLLGDIIPSTMLVSDFYNHGGELSNRQSSGVTFGDLGQDMQQLPSPTNLDYNWNVGVWNHVPEMY